MTDKHVSSMNKRLRDSVSKPVYEELEEAISTSNGQLGKLTSLVAESIEAEAIGDKKRMLEVAKRISTLLR